VTEQDLLAQIRGVIEERDTLRDRVASLAGLEARLERQGQIIAKVRDLMEELQRFIDQEEPVQPAAEMTATPQAQAPVKSGRRYTDQDVYQWVSALRAGATQLEVSKTYDASPTTVAKRVRDLGFDSVNGEALTVQAEAWWAEKDARERHPFDQGAQDVAVAAT
jgi:hypothetical protein